MKHLLGLCACVLLVPFVFADLTIKGETKVGQHRLVRLSVEGVPEGAAILWEFDEEKIDAQEAGNKLVFTAPPGVYKLKCRAITLSKDGKTQVETARVTVTVEGKVIPPDPGPGPGPKPPEPTPDGEAPISGPGYRVLIVYETAELSRYPAKQHSVLYSKPLRTWLKEACVTDKDNPNGAFRIYDKDVDTSAESKSWQEAMKRPRKSLPWIIVSNGRTGYEGPLPADAESTLTLLKKYAEAK